MDWSRHAKGSSSNKRVAVPVNAELRQAIDLFKKIEDGEFTDSAVLQTMIEAGFKQWGAEKARLQQELDEMDSIDE